MYKWKVNNPNIDQSKLVEEIYRLRGISNYQELFSLNEEHFHDPYLLNDMQKSVDRIMKAVKDNERILIYGDYDVDGITSTYILYKVLLDLGADISYDIPNRFVDGYGLTYSKTFDIVNDEIDLVITVDNGIKSIEEAKILKDNNIDLIITDHHERESQLPEAYAIIHTSLSTYPFKPLAGVGVAFKLAQALIGDDALEYVDIAALGTIADMMPLVEENRAIVNVGLAKMQHSSNIGLSKLIDFLDIISPSVADIQYKIAPRINACGRMKSAKLAVELLLSTTNKHALQHLKEIEENNNRRKKLTKTLYEEALSQIDNNTPCIIIHSPRMHEGVIGIVASRLANEYAKVCVVLKKDEYTFKGSVRSYNGVDVLSVLHSINPLLIRYGGHQNAAGLEFRKELLDEFKEQFTSQIPHAKTEQTALAEGVIDIYRLDPNQIYDLDRYDLKDSLFIFDNIEMRSKYLIKGEHTKIIISNDVEAIFFNNKTMYSKINKASDIVLLGRLDINIFRGQTKKQIIIDDYEIINM